jgi:hypothetical protein
MDISSIASMVSPLDACTCIVEIYRTAPVSIPMLPTREVIERRSQAWRSTWAPGQNAVSGIGTQYQTTGLDLPMTMVGFSGSVRNETSCGSRIALIPPSFTFNLYRDQIRSLKGTARYLLEGYVGVVVGIRKDAFRGLHALCDNTSLQAKIIGPSEMSRSDNNYLDITETHT